MRRPIPPAGMYSLPVVGYYGPGCGGLPEPPGPPDPGTAIHSP